MLTETLILIASLAIIFYIWQRRAYNYWQRLGVTHIKPTTFFGNMRRFLTAKIPFFEQIRELHNTKGFEKEPLIGVYLMHRPAVIVRDLDLVKTVMIKKFSYFSNRALQTDPHHDPLGYNNLFFVRDADWKDLRNKISPVFTTGKTKQMYPLMCEIGSDLETHLKSVPEHSMIAIKNVCARFTTDLIATIAFGVKANSLRDVKSEFLNYNKAVFEVNWRRGIDFTIIFMLPALATLARVKVFSKGTSQFIRETLKYIMAERERSGELRRDLVDTLLAMKRETPNQPNSKAYDLDYLYAQAAIFQIAGYETSSSTMTLTIFELAHHPDIQTRLRQEIMDYFGDANHIDYERIQEMPYLNQVVNETLRKYPIVGYAERECTQPSSGERFTLAPYYDVELTTGTPVYISTLAIHRDPQYWPDPDKYDPERFAPENRHNLNMDAYMPFGIGPRNCIGMRLGLLQTKLGLVHLLRNHRIQKCAKTTKTVEFAPMSSVITPKDDVFVQLERV